MTFYETSDVNNDGAITSSDITAIYNILCLALNKPNLNCQYICPRQVF